MPANNLLARVVSLVGSSVLGFGLAAALLAASSAAAAPAGTTRDYPGGSCSTTLQACVNGSAGGDTIRIHGGVYTESFTLDRAVSLVKGPGGAAVILAAPGQRVLTVTGAAINSSVVISGLTLAGGHAVGAGCPSGCGGGVLVTGGAQPLFQGDVISRNLADVLGGGIYAGAGSPLSLSGLTVISNSANSGIRGMGGGVYVAGRLTAANTQFISNTTVYQGGGALAGGVASLTGGLFQGNSASSIGGGGLYVSDTVALTGTHFINNRANIYGGGLEMRGYPTSVMTITDALFQGNSAGQGAGLGGGVQAQYDLVTTSVITIGASPVMVTVFNTQFISNSAEEGAGLYDLGPVTATNSRFERNQGGGLFGLGLALNNTDFLTNTNPISVESGGGAMALSGNVRVVGGLFQNNHAGDVGGGLAVVNGGGDLNGTRFIGNSSGVWGGGAYMNVTSTVRNGLFQGNTSSDGGGLFQDLAIDVQNTQFIANHAITGSGGGLNINVYGFPNSVADSLFQSNTAAADGGGLYDFSFTSLTRTQFISNGAGGNGGGEYNICCLSENGAVFSGNHAGSAGGGLYVFSLTASLTSTQFFSNSAVGNGGGLYSGGPTTLLLGWLQGNTAASGGGVYAADAFLAQRSAFLNNSAANGGGLYQTGPGGKVINSLFVGDRASTAGAGMYFGGGNSAVIFDTLAGTSLNPRQAVYVSAGTLRVTDTILAGYAVGLSQAGGTVSEAYNLFFGNTQDKTGTIGAGGHSLFGQNPEFKDPAAGDYHLDIGSAALDKGVSAGVFTDYDGDPRPVGVGFDIGFDERDSVLFLPVIRR